MSTGPRVSVVIPTWNRAALLDEAIASVGAQTYRNWELIVADDGSTDGTVAALRARADPRVRVLALDHRGNPARLRNAGVAAGSGEFLAFLDSDDLWMPDKLALQVAACRDAPARWCCAGYGHADADGQPLADSPVRFRPGRGPVLRPLLLGETSVSVSTLFVERALFDAVGGFDERLVWRPDVDLALRLAACADPVAIAAPLALIRIHPGRSTAGARHPHLATARVFEMLLERETDPELRAIARTRRSELLLDAAAQRLARRDVLGSMRLLAAVAASRGGLSCLARRAARRLRRGRAPS